MALLLVSDNFAVLEVIRRNGIVEKVVIRNWPFVMTFMKTGNKVKLVGFARYDGSQDGFRWIPRHYFVPAIRRAWAIFEMGNLRAS